MANILIASKKESGYTTAKVELNLDTAEPKEVTDFLFAYSNTHKIETISRSTGLSDASNNPNNNG